MPEEKARLLVIEDSREVRENLAEILELSGYAVLTAPDGLAGAKLAIERLPDLILCDVMMPELDGYGVLNLLSENARTAPIPFVFITARTETEDIRRGMNLGADDYITKPFYKDELLRVIHTRLKKATLRQQQATAAAPVDRAPREHLSSPERGLELLAEAFAREGRPKVYERGATIVREEEYPHFLYRIERGSVHLSRLHVYGREYIIAALEAEELFGISSVLEREPFPYTARAATEEVHCRLLPAPQLIKLINTERSVTEALMHLLARRATRYGEQLVQQAYDSVRRRTALTLCDLHERQSPGSRAIELSREELAQMVGSTKESVTRALSDFRRAGLLRTENRSIYLVEPAELRQLLI